MKILTRDVLAHARLFRAFGRKGAGHLVKELWPVWDATMAAVIYRNGRPLYASTVAVGALGQRARTELDLPPAKELLGTTAGVFCPDNIPRYCKTGPWEVVWLAEIPYPVPVRPLDPQDLDLYPRSPLDAFMLARAAGNSCFNSETRWQVVADGGDVLHLAFELAEALGYDPRDSSWVPSAWRQAPVPIGLGYRFDTVKTAEGGSAMLRSYTARIGTHSVYLPRLWFDDPSDAVAIQVDVASLASGNADEATPRNSNDHE